MGQKEILLFQWDSIGKDDVKLAFEKIGFVCDALYLGSGAQARKESNFDVIRAALKAKNYYFAFSTNYFYSLANACYEAGVPYLSWSYDSPMRVDEEEKITMNTNHVFFFDSLEAKYYRDKYKASNVHHLSLAVNVDRYDELLKKNIGKYSSDVSFVGRLYDSNFGKAMELLDDYKRSFFMGVADAALRLRDSDCVYSICNDGLINWINNKEFCDAVNAEFERPEDTFRTYYRLGILLCKYATNKERILLLSMLSNHFETSLYSDTSHELLKNVKECGTVEYMTESPFVFKNSKINLNSSFISIRAGIPLRCLDIMACGGVLLSNHQRDFDEHFEDGKNVLLYHSLEEAYEKCEYYLANEDERKKIALAGYETVKKYYNYPVKLKELLDMAGLKVN